MNRCLFMIAGHKSGGSLLRALLDGHPDLWVVPKESHPYAAAGLPVSYALRPRRGGGVSSPWSPDGIEAFLSREAVEDSPTSDAPGFRLDPREVRRRFEALDGVEPKVCRYLMAFGGMCGLPPPQAHQWIVEKSVEHVALLDSLLRDVPEARFLGVVRHPAASLVAVRRARQRTAFPYLTPILRGISQSFTAAERLRDMKGRRAMVVRYEDLVANPGGIMSEIMNWLEVPPQSCVETPTSLGRTWSGNSSSGRSFDQVNRAPVEAWKEVITPLEAWRMIREWRPAYSRFGYEPPRSRGFPKRAESGENWRLFVRHRWAGCFGGRM